MSLKSRRHWVSLLEMTRKNSNGRGRTLLRKLKHDALLITRGKDGMALFERGKKTAHISGPRYG